MERRQFFEFLSCFHCCKVLYVFGCETKWIGSKLTETKPCHEVVLVGQHSRVWPILVCRYHSPPSGQSNSPKDRFDLKDVSESSFCGFANEDIFRFESSSNEETNDGQEFHASFSFTVYLFKIIAWALSPKKTMSLMTPLVDPLAPGMCSKSVREVVIRYWSALLAKQEVHQQPDCAKAGRRFVSKHSRLWVVTICGHRVLQ